MMTLTTKMTNPIDLELAVFQNNNNKGQDGVIDPKLAERLRYQKRLEQEGGEKGHDETTDQPREQSHARGNPRLPPPVRLVPRAETTRFSSLVRCGTCPRRRRLIAPTLRLPKRTIAVLNHRGEPERSSLDPAVRKTRPHRRMYHPLPRFAPKWSFIPANRLEVMWTKHKNDTYAPTTPPCSNDSRWEMEAFPS